MLRGAALGALLGVLGADLGYGLLAVWETGAGPATFIAASLSGLPWLALLGGPGALVLSLGLASLIRLLAGNGFTLGSRMAVGALAGAPLGLANLALVLAFFGRTPSDSVFHALIVPAIAGGLGLGLGAALGAEKGARP